MDRDAECVFGVVGTAYVTRNCRPGDCLLLVDGFEPAPELLQLAKTGKQRRVLVYGITHWGANPLIKFCNLHLNFWEEEKLFRGQVLRDCSGLMILLSCLCEALYSASQKEQSLGDDS